MIYGYISCEKGDNSAIPVIRCNTSPNIELVCCKSMKIDYYKSQGQYLSAIPEIIANASFFVPIISPKSVDSELLQRELSFAYNRKIPIIPVFTKLFSIRGPLNLLLSEVGLVYILGDRNFPIDFRSKIDEITGNNL